MWVEIHRTHLEQEPLLTNIYFTGCSSKEPRLLKPMIFYGVDGFSWKMYGASAVDCSTSSEHRVIGHGVMR
jgi:hypothetical protein